MMKLFKRKKPVYFDLDSYDYSPFAREATEEELCKISGGTTMSQQDQAAMADACKNGDAQKQSEIKAKYETKDSPTTTTPSAAKGLATPSPTPVSTTATQTDIPAQTTALTHEQQYEMAKNDAERKSVASETGGAHGSNSSTSYSSGESTSYVSTNSSGKSNSTGNLKSKGNVSSGFTVDYSSKTVSADINDLKGIYDAYSAYYVLSDHGYSFNLKDGSNVVHTFAGAEPVKKYLKARTSSYNDVTGYSKKEITQFEEMSAKEQLDFLKTEKNSVEYGTPEAGAKAKFIRNQLKEKMNLKGLFYGMDGDEIFMNEDLRGFLNLNEKGTNEYSMSDMNLRSGWHQMLPYLGDNEHQNKQNGGRNVKYYNNDGREAIFDAKDNYISTGMDEATYNYGTTGNLNLISTMLGSSHGQYDMKPFYRQNGTASRWWNMAVGYNYGFNSKLR